MVFGFVKKVFKGIKKAVSSTWKRMKKAFKSIGKFMGKIGIIGQIGLALLLPGVGQILSNMLIGAVPGVTGGLAGALQGMGAIEKAASGFIKGAVKFASNTSKFFGSITDGVKQVVGDTIGAAAQSLGIGADTAIGKGLTKIGVNMDVNGWGGIFTNAEKSLSKIGSSFTNIFTTNPAAEQALVQSNIVSAKGQAQVGSVGADLSAKTESLLSTDSVLNPTELQSNIDPFGDEFGFTGTKGGITYEAGPSPYGAPLPDPQIPNMAGDVAKALQENIATQGGAGTAADPFFASGATTTPVEPKSLLEKTSELITGQSIDENITAMKAEAASAVKDFLPETGSSMAKEALYQAAGLSPKPEDFRSVAYGGSVNLPSMEGTAIGTDFMTSPYQSVIQSVSPQFAMANPYGIMAQQYNFNQYAAQLQRTA
jgi:hypothetical protein